MGVPEFMQSNSLRPDRRVADQVLRLVLVGIEIGQLEAGATISDHEWADALGVSRTPVREAIQRLTGMGLLEVAAARYTKLRSFTLPEAHNETCDWALLHAALLQSVIPHTLDTLAESLIQIRKRSSDIMDAPHAIALSFEFFHTLRAATPTSAITLGATAAAYRLRLAAQVLTNSPAIDCELQAGVVRALIKKDTHGIHQLFDEWVCREQYAFAA